MRLIDADALKANFKTGRWYQGEAVIDEIEDAATIETGWISVKERLPDDEYECLIAYAPHEYCWIGWYKADEQRWIIHGAVCEDGFITHWMPLPEPPKEGT